MQAVEANYCFGARYYDSNLGRWLTPDPLADKYPGWSPYNYVMNNPLRLIDPNGMGINDSVAVANQQENEQQLKKDKQELSEAWDNGDVLGVVGNFFEVLWDGVKTQTPTLSLMPEVGVIEVGTIETGTALVSTTNIGDHAAGRMAERNITSDMVKKTIEKGEKYFDPKNKSFNYIIKEGMASGKHIIVGTNTLSGKVTTAIVRSRLIKRLIPLKK